MKLSLIRLARPGGCFAFWQWWKFFLGSLSGRLSKIYIKSINHGIRQSHFACETDTCEIPLISSPVVDSLLWTPCLEISISSLIRPVGPLALVALVAPAWACIINEDDVLGPAEGCHDEWPCCPRVSSGPHLILSHCPARRTIIFHAFKKGRRRWRGENGHK